MKILLLIKFIILSVSCLLSQTGSSYYSSIPFTKAFSVDTSLEIPEINEVQSFGNDISDSIAKLELKKYYFPNRILLATNGNELIESKGINILSSDSLINKDTLHLSISSSFEITRYATEEFRYQFVGYEIFRRFYNGGEELIVGDSLWRSDVADTSNLRIPMKKILKNKEGGSYKIKFREVCRIDSKNRRIKYWDEKYKSFEFYIKLIDGISGGYGYPRLVLIVDDEIYHENDLIAPKAELYLSLLVSPNFIKKYPDEIRYQIRGVKITEMTTPSRSPNIERLNESYVSDWSLDPKIKIPIDSILPENRGEYYLEITELRRMDSNGYIYYQDIQVRSDRYINFRIDKTIR